MGVCTGGGLGVTCSGLGINRGTLSNFDSSPVTNILLALSGSEEGIYKSSTLVVN